MQDETGEVLQRPATIVLDFDGAELRYVPDAPSDPDEGTTPFSECAGTWPPYEDAQRAAKLLDAVRELYADFDVVVTDERPCERPYLRVVVGPFPRCGLGVGYAESSCERTIGHGLVYAKLDPESDRTVMQEAIVIAHEVGHALGLAHVDNPYDVMHPSVGAGDKVFLDQCSPMDPSSGADSCQLIGHCPTLRPYGQNSYFGLMSLLGPSDETTRMRVCADESGADQGCGCHEQHPSRHRAALAMLVLILRFRNRPRHARTCDQARD